MIYFFVIMTAENTLAAGYKNEIRGFARLVFEKTAAHYGGRLVSFVIFGSVARDLPRPDSDIDILIVANDLPRGRMPRVNEFTASVERTLEADMRGLRIGKGINTELSPVFKTPAEVEAGSPLFLDMTLDAWILYDRDGFCGKYLDSLTRKLARLGSRRVMRGGGWYWLLKPDYRPGDVIEL